MALARRTLGNWLLAAWLLGGGLAWGHGDGPVLPPIVPPGIALPAHVVEPPCGRGEVCLPPPPPPCPIDPPIPIVTVRVRVPACAPPGQDIEYRICVENCSPADAHHVVIRNQLPANAKFVRAIPEPTETQPELRWKLGTMFGGERRQIVLVLAPTGPGDVTNCTRVQFEYGQCVTTRLAGCPPPFMPPDVTVQPGVPVKEPPVPVPAGDAKLKLTMTGPKQQYTNLPAQYFLTVTNTGKAAATNLLLTAQLPPELQFDRASMGGKFVEGQVAWILGNLEAGASRTLELVVKAEASGEFCIRGIVLADRGLTDRAEICTLFQGTSAILLELTDRKDPVEVGGETSYVIEVGNQGGAAATNIQVKALVPAALGYLRAKGAEVKLGERTPDGYQTLLFEPVKSLAAGAKLEIEVFCKALRAGEARFKVEVRADQLERGPVREEESTMIFAEDGAGKE
jgi:uncharacterized repeat protein (TIGR01451 family)